MAVLHNSLNKYIAEKIQTSLTELFPETSVELSEIYGLIGEPPNLKMGHFTFPCFTLAKSLRSNPAQIGKALAESIKTCDVVTKVLGQGPYINFFVSTDGVGKNIVEKVLDNTYFTDSLIDSKEKVMVEYSQPNTHKILHVGHMRNLCLGNALIRMSRYVGQDIVAVTYPGDVGTHVAKCLWYMKYHNTEAVPTENKGEWLGAIYTLANEKLENEKETEHFEPNKEKLTAILKELHAGSGEFHDLWLETKEWSVELMNSAYKWADVEFDRWFWESEVDAPSVKYINELYADNKLIKSEGAVGMDLTEEKLGFCILLKSDGTGLYSSKDVELAKVKFEEFGIDKSVYIVDNRQAHHFKQVFSVLSKLGFKQAEDCFHLQYAMVELPDGAMSSRKGNIVPLMELVEQMEEKIKSNYLQKYLDDKESGWTEAEVNETSSIIANGAIKYGMIKVDNNRKIVFDINEWLKLDGDTGPYLQYVCARIHSLGKKMNYNSDDSVDWNVLEHDLEMALMLKLSHFNKIVIECVDQLKTIHICSYLFELCKLFNSFYAECSIGKADNEELKKARLALAMATGSVVTNGLSIIGIKAPLRM